MSGGENTLFRNMAYLVRALLGRQFKPQRVSLFEDRRTRNPGHFFQTLVGEQ